MTSPRGLGRSVRQAVLAVATAGALVLSGAPSAPAAAPDDTPGREARAVTLRLVGNGFGHGRGMSQWGAQKQALAGRGHQQILAFYYPGLATGTSSGTVRVLLTADTTDDVVVVARGGLEARSLAGGRTVALAKPQARLWRVRSTDGGARSLVSWKGRAGWRAFRTLPGEVEVAAGGQPVTLVTPTGRRAYRGSLRSTRPTPSSARRDTVNVVPLESYLRGVVPREVFTSWEPAALRAQAVAARTYAAFERADHETRWFQVYDTTASQVYGGVVDEVGSTDAAIAATARQVLTVGGEPAFTQFSASNGGWMSAGSRPYLVAKEDPFDDTYRGWTDSVGAAEVERALPALGRFERVGVVERDGNGQWGGRVISIQLVGSQATTTISGETFRSYFGLNSSWFTLR